MFTYKEHDWHVGTYFIMKDKKHFASISLGQSLTIQRPDHEKTIKKIVAALNQGD